MKTTSIPIVKRLVMAALSLGLPLTTLAEDLDMGSWVEEPINQTQRFGISPFYGYRFGGSVEDLSSGTEYDFDAGPAYGLTLDYAPRDSYMRMELLWSRQDSAIDFQGNNGLNNVDVTVDVFQLGGLVEFGSERWREYVSAHVGATHFSADNFGDNTRFSFGFGLGGKVFLTKNFYLRVDLHAFCNLVEAEGTFIFSNGIAVASFSGSTLWQGQVSAGVGVTF